MTVDCNAIIESTMLGIEDCGVMSCMLYLKFEGSGQGFGGYTLDQYIESRKRRVGWGPGLDFIMQILTTVGVTKWEDLKGKYIRVRHDQPGLRGKIVAIGHIIEDRWFDPEVCFREAGVV